MYLLNMYRSVNICSTYIAHKEKHLQYVMYSRLTLLVCGAVAHELDSVRYPLDRLAHTFVDSRGMVLLLAHGTYIGGIRRNPVSGLVASCPDH